MKQKEFKFHLIRGWSSECTKKRFQWLSHVIYVCILNDLYFQRNAWECLRLLRNKKQRERKKNSSPLGNSFQFPSMIKETLRRIRHFNLIRQHHVISFVQNRTEIDAVNCFRVVNILFSKNLRFTKAKHFFFILSLFFWGSLKAAKSSREFFFSVVLKYLLLSIDSAGKF